MSSREHSTKERSIIPLNDTNFYVFWEDELEHYHVTINAAGDLTCHHRSDGEKCWPWYQHPGHCPHTERVEKYLRGDKDEPEAKPLSPAAQFIAQGGSLETIFDYSQPYPVNTHRATSRRKVSARY